ncbi:Antibiotic efflux pump membrane transporter ArpB [Pseudoalteromonas holothuriae]|uniref:Antibiotic efflux pump membrane transporter ArpB n=1 Tax=Pseudoalteromonas holothuriae TaxID=2963714 RepID=A0A9W4QR41_9GAMM|nr:MULTISPECIES: efflux RND transporter permease subunit [unclassified Pseudoalteromonas]CAH9049673.1 Antibiotic efflux pump membrane transporter ArpB [Pseudoalteromonas sp. CIP111854]CAH9051597.1 Antibiotic efflux pump membrane transporter ArpB [Pseudoalteromonas sp. CIP111951]
MIQWFIRHPIASNLLMMFLLLGGLLSANNMRKEIVPKLPSNQLVISTYYEGKTAEQVDREIGQKIDRALEGISGIKSINSIAGQNSLTVTIVKLLDYDMNRLMADVKSSIDSIYDWPLLAERPQIIQETLVFDALLVQLHGDTDPDSLIKVGETVKQKLLSYPAIQKIEEYGAHSYAVYIQVDPYKMRQYGLSFDDISTAINRQSVRAKSGVLKTPNGKYLLYSDHVAETEKMLSSLVVTVTEQGHIIYLSDIADIKDDITEHDSNVTFNNQATMGFAVKMSATSDVLEISEQTELAVKEIKASLPNNLDITVWFNAAHYVQERLDLLQTNAIQGFLLVFIILTLFLNMRLAFWVAMGLPVAIAGTFIVLGELGFQYTINEVTTFGFILVLGILVDDAVVVGESIYSYKEKHGTSIESTIKGTERVAIPTIFGVLTTVAALLPMTRFPSETGRLFAGFAWVVIVALLFSLIESKLILPAHLRSLKFDNEANSFTRKLTVYPRKLLDLLAHKIYRPVLDACLRYRYVCLFGFLSMVFGILGSLQNGTIRSVMFPDVPSDLIILELNLEQNVPVSLLQKAEAQVKAVRANINEQYKQTHALDGDIIEKAMTVTFEQGNIVVFAEPIRRDLRTEINLRKVANQWRKALLDIEALQSVEVTVSLEGTSAGTYIRLNHPDINKLNEISEFTKQWLTRQEGVNNVLEENLSAMPQLAFTLKPEAQLFGITHRMLSEQLATAYGGLELDRFYRDEHRVKLYLTFHQQMRDSRSDLNSLYIYNDKGQPIPLSAVADVETTTVNNTLTRFNGELTRSLKIDVDKSVISPEQLYTQLERIYNRSVKSQYPNAGLKRAGELEQTVESTKGLGVAFTVAIALIYVLLAIPLKRYGQPLLIVFSVPFGLVGAVLGHVWLGLSVSLYSWLGMLTLSGVVVNDSLLIVNRYNQLCHELDSKVDAVRQACLDRFRAIFLTTITTFAGLLPLLNETSEQAQYLIPAAVSLAYGLLFATLICLILMPTLLIISSDIKAFVTMREFTMAKAHQTQKAKAL